MASRKSFAVLHLFLSLLVLLFFGARLAQAINHSPQGVIKHVIIVVQENRTPDSLFYDDLALYQAGGNVRPTSTPVCKKWDNNGHITETGPVPMVAYPLDNACFDNRHSHQNWLNMYDRPTQGQPGDMQGACMISVTHFNNCTTAPACPSPLTGICPQYTYVPNIQAGPNHNILDPYFDIANTYGFANWMWQTNQGPSFPAHQFLFSGTSAPTAYNDPQGLYKWFAAENPSWPGHSDRAGRSTGCVAPTGAYVRTIDTSGTEGGSCPSNGGAYCYYPCYNHPTLPTDVLETHGLNWRYYARDYNRDDNPDNTKNIGSLWTSPNSYSTICGPPHSEHCAGDEWNNHVGNYLTVKNPIDQAPILTDIEDCNQDFPAVAWVIPDGYWSDHPGYDSSKHPGAHDGGPSWVAHIVNAVGNHTCSPGNTHDVAKWSNTVILIVWDDWGGFYDHVSPDTSAGGPGIGYPDTEHSGSQYVHGFRVPLLVVSAYGNPHYISGAGVGTPACTPGFSSSYCHDFGSILNFIEFTFGSGGTPLNEVDSQYPFPYADHWAPDSAAYCPTCTYSLADFFADFNTAQPFTSINSWKYPETCFHNPDQSGCFPGYKPEDADDDADDTQ